LEAVACRASTEVVNKLAIDKFVFSGNEFGQKYYSVFGRHKKGLKMQ
jgi:hypothetical protein